MMWCSRLCWAIYGQKSWWNRQTRNSGMFGSQDVDKTSIKKFGALRPHLGLDNKFMRSQLHVCALQVIDSLQFQETTRLREYKWWRQESMVRKPYYTMSNHQLHGVYSWWAYHWKKAVCKASQSQKRHQALFRDLQVAQLYMKESKSMLGLEWPLAPCEELLGDSYFSSDEVKRHCLRNRCKR